MAYISHLLVLAVLVVSPFDSPAYAWQEEGLREAPHPQNDLSPWIYPQRLTEKYITQILELDGIDPAEINPAAKEQYSAAWAGIESGPGRIIEELAEATILDPKNSERPTYIATPDVLRLLEARKKAFALATQADDILFQELMAGQSTPIQQNIISLKNQRKADMHQLRTLLPGSQIDLEEIINELNIDDLVRKTIQLIIEEYKTERTPLIIKRWEDLNKLDTSEVNLHIELGPKWQQVLNGELKSQAFEQLRRIDSARIRTEFPLRELNSNYIQRIVKILPSPLSMDFRSRCNTTIYPKISAEMKCWTFLGKNVQNPFYKINWK